MTKPFFTQLIKSVFTEKNEKLIADVIEFIDAVDSSKLAKSDAEIGGYTIRVEIDKDNDESAKFFMFCSQIGAHIRLKIIYDNSGDFTFFYEGNIIDTLRVGDYYEDKAYGEMMRQGYEAYKKMTK